MITTTIDKKYIEDFEKKFKGFCERAPVYLSYSILYDEVHIKDVSNGKTFSFLLDESNPIKDLITSIKITLKEKSYPHLIEEKIERVDPSVSDLLDATRDNISFDEAFASLSRRVSKTEYIIDKINLKKNQIIIENIKTKEQFLYHLKMPVVMFLKNEIRNEQNPAEAFLSLKKKGEFLYKIERKQ